MDIQRYTYQNIHEYLDAIFKDILNPSNEDIVKAKREYWRIRNKHIKRKWRKEHTICTIAFRDNEIKLLRQYITGDIPLSRFIKTQILLLVSEEKVQHPINLTHIEQQLFRIADFLEEIIDNEWVIDAKRIQFLENAVKELQELLNQSFDCKNKNIQEK